MTQSQLENLLQDILKQPKESEWVEFKVSYDKPDMIGQRISALSNGACIKNQRFGYLVFGVEDATHKIVGTSFKPKEAKKGKEELEHWVVQRLKPRIDFEIEEFEIDGKQIVIFIIPATTNTPVEFFHNAYIRVGSYTRNLNDFPEKARKIWNKKDKTPFEGKIAKENVAAQDIVNLLATQSYFDLLKLPYPSNRDGVIEKFKHEDFITKTQKGYNITNLGALLFAKDINEFEGLKRKAVRVIVYDGKSKLKTIREQLGKRGYAVGFEGLVNWVNGQLPSNEVIGKALRQDVKMYPELAIRELIANALIHQDLEEKGFPMIEIYDDRIEISNPGLPLITPQRFIDEYQSRNEKLADIMRRLGICEEKGSGIDKVVHSSEAFQLPAPDFIIQERHTKAVMYSYKTLNDMDKKDKIRAAYQHSCLKYVMNEKMTNESLRERFKIEKKNAAIASRIIKDTLTEQLIKDDDPSSKSKKYVRYIPFWA